MDIEFVAGFSPIVADVAAARALYSDDLGIAFEGGEGDYVYTERLGGSKHLGLWPLSHAAQACFGTDSWSEDLPVPQATIEFEVADVAAAAAELRAAGHDLLHDVREEPWGQTIARLLSPDGLLVAVCRTPSHHDE